MHGSLETGEPCDACVTHVGLKSLSRWAENIMRCVIARLSFDLTKSGVVESMKGVRREPVTGEFVIIGRRHYPAKQVGEVVTRQDRRDSSTGARRRPVGARARRTVLVPEHRRRHCADLRTGGPVTPPTTRTCGAAA